jgi:pimeloyl-ACP methyl ester carboxylesterase
VSARTTVLLAGLLAAVAAPADAATFAPCAEAPAPIVCSRVPVPVDRSGGVPGTIDLAIYRAPATGPSKGVLLVLPGGPGDGGLAYLVRRLSAFDEARATHDVVVMDPRGAGRSAPLRCDDAAACAAELGATSRLYTSRDVADDADAVREALGVERIAVYGVSYGGWYAQTYARRHPEHVAALALDAPVGRADIDDPFSRSSFAARPGALRALCDPCSRDPYADAAAVVRKLPTATLATVAAAAATLDLNPAVRAELGAAAAARRAGDPKPLARLAEGALLQPPEDRTRFNPGANVVVQCEERALPWERTTPPQQRLAEAQRRLATIPPAAFAPFGPAFALLSGLVPQCLDWPAAPESPTVGGDLPPVPALVLAGEADVRVPPAGVRDVAAAIPGATYMELGDVGHGGLGEEPTGCVSRALAAVVNAQPIVPCRAAGLKPRPPFARRLAEVPGRDRRRRVVSAAVLTATDAINQAALRVDALRHTVDDVRFAGLRGGRAHGDEDRVALHDAQWLRGLKVSGTARADGRHELRLAGLARGRLRVRGARVTGRVDGVAVRVRIDRERVGAAGVPVGAML